MSGTMCRVSVYTGTEEASTVDLALPARVPLGALMPEIVRITEAGPPDGVPCWQLHRIGGLPLDERRTLVEHAIHDGELLILEAADAVVPSFARPDPMASLIAATPRRVTTPPIRTLTGSVAALAGALLCATVPVAVTGRLVAVGTAAALLCAAALAAVLTGRSRPASAPAGLLSALAVFLAAVSGARVVPGELSVAHVLLAAAAAATMSMVLLRLDIGFPAMLIAFTGSAVLTAAALTGVALRLPVASVGAALTLLGLLTLSVSARLSILLAGLGRAALAEQIPDVDERAATGHRILGGLVCAATAAVALGSLAVAAGTLHRNGPWVAGAAYCAVVGVVLALRARSMASGHCQWGLLVGALCCLATGSAIGASGAPQYAHWAGALGVCCGVIALLRDGRGAVSPVAARAVDLGEYAMLAAVVPLACAVLGLFGLVRNLSLT